MRQLAVIGDLLMGRRGNKTDQHYVSMGNDYKVAYEVVGEL